MNYPFTTGPLGLNGVRGTARTAAFMRVVIVTLVTILLMALFTPANAQEKLDSLRFRHPTSLAFAAPFQLLQDSEQLLAFANEIDVAPWSTPDILRSLLVTGGSDVTAVPTYVGANLANRGIDVKMAAVVVWGILHVLGPEGTPMTWESLRGETVMVPFPNDMPDLVFRHLAEANGLIPGEDFEVQYFAKPQDVVAQLVSGRGQWAVMSEHTATLAIMNAKKNGNDIGRVLDLQEEWAVVTGNPRIPQAAVVVPDWISEERPELLAAVLDALTEAVAKVNEASPETVAALAAAFDLPEQVVADVIPRLNLEVTPAGDVQDELEAFYSELAKRSPDIIGGHLPPASFYLPDPR